MRINQKVFERYKASLHGLYNRFNTNVTKYYIRKMLPYEEMINNAPNFNSFEDFYYFYTTGKEDIIDRNLDLMVEEYNRKFKTNITKDLAFKCFVVRLGNLYNGIATEHRLLVWLGGLRPWLIIEKTDAETDQERKVDAIITVAGIGQIAIQIKPLSHTGYDKGSEKEYHKLFEKETGIKVHYLFYRNRDQVVFNGRDIFIGEDDEKIVENIEKLIYS